MTVDMFKSFRADGDDPMTHEVWDAIAEVTRYEWVMQNASRIVGYEGTRCPLSAVSDEWRHDIAVRIARQPIRPTMLDPAEMTQARWTSLSEHQRLLWLEDDDNNTAVLAYLAKQPSPPVMMVETLSYNEPPLDASPSEFVSSFSVAFGEPKSAFIEAAKTWLRGNMSRKLRIEYNHFSDEGEPPHVFFRITSNGVSQATGIRGDEAGTDAGWTKGLKLAIDLMRERFS